MTPEMQQALDDASVPFWQDGGAIGIEQTRMKSWRYFLECNSACNLHCPTCTKGNVEGYAHKNGIMDADLMERILDKIQFENPKAIVFLYGNSEPFLHPRLAECVSSIKRRGLNAQFSTNCNFVQHEDEVIAAGPDMIIISLSGFTQDTYVRGHAGGDIEKVKANMKLLADANKRSAHPVNISVNYHIYNDNEHELPLMKEYAEGLGLGFFSSYARAISMENAIQYCRSHDPNATPFDIQEGRPDWNKEFPPAGKTYADAMTRIKIPPTVARAMYSRLPAFPVCPIGTMFTFIRHDGKTQLCACTADRRVTLGDYLETTQDELAEQRTGHAICQQCTKYHLRYYFHIVDKETWTPA
jgi:MoaA/NifB/PqqE/SkfB family radical SAM enzyme